eukprot:NODE_267_length_12253_cov_0.255718.p1 type:complete len:1034 gc:universal NODE_267_length_12253_cov_0.255718:6499-3398(-)
MDKDIENTLTRKRASVFELAQLTSQFVLTPEDLSKIVSFDERVGNDLLQMLNLSYDGVEGIANLLRVNPDVGLEYGSAIESTVSLHFKKPEGKSGKLKLNLLKNAMLNSSIKINKVQKLPIDAGVRIDRYGQNIIPLAPSLTVFGIVWNTATEDPILKILIIGSVVILVLGLVQDPISGWAEGVAILIAVFIVLTVTAGNDFYKDKKFRKLLLLQSDKKCKVLRDSSIDVISSWDLIVGDIVMLETGDEIPADGLYFSGTRLVVDESPLTGESFPVKKSSKSPFLFSGCLISEGLAKMLVTSVGIRSNGGKIQQLLNDDQHTETPLQIQLSNLANLVGKIGFGAGILTFLVLLIRYLSTGSHFDDGANSILSHLAHFFIIGVTMVVVAVPEGLPLAVTISLAFSMFKMIEDKCFVRHLRASETMGQATVICTDKTGTLTENKMNCVKCFIDGRVHENQNWDSLVLRYLPLLNEAISSNTTALLVSKNNNTSFIGSATEGALLLFLKNFDVDYNITRKSIQIAEQFLFTSDRKSMSTLLKPLNLVDFDNSFPLARLHSKGAPEKILSQCTTQFKNSQITVLTEYEKQQLRIIIEQWSNHGHRVLGLALKNYTTLITEDELQMAEHDLTFLCLFAIKDPVRKQVPLAVVQCQLAGVQIKMVTGDAMMTAINIAMECNILKANYCVNMQCLLEENRYKQIVMDGVEFRRLSRDQCAHIAPRLAVLSRSSPTDKHTLVTILKELQETVAVTGDGTNDAAALKSSDVGFAMGVCGTQIAINSSDIILLDDNFASIVNAIKWGRNVLQVVKKFLQFQLSVNVVAIATTIIGSVVLGSEPLDTVQLLWVNLIMDTLGALALATDVPDVDILLEKPIKKNSFVLTKHMMYYVTMQSGYQLAVMILFILNYPMANTKASLVNQQTMIFTQFVVLQIFNEVTARQLNGELNIFKGLWGNPYFVTTMTIIALVQFCMVQFGTALGTEPLNGEEWLICVLFGIGDVVFIIFTRLLLKVFKKPQKKDLEHVEIASIQTSTILYEEE